MLAKIVFVACATLLFAKAFECQCIQQGIGLGNSYMYPGSNVGVVNNIGLSGFKAGNCACNLQPLFPSSITISSDDLQIGGQVAVAGSMPIYATVAVNGEVPSNGQAELSSGCGSNVVLNSAGIGGSNFAGSSYFINNLGGNSVCY